jgi:DNA-binding transcriptional MerR regulator
MDIFTIKDLENLSGIKAHTIRIWEQRYQFLKPRRTSTNIRYYSNDQLKTLLNISLLTRHGFKISHIDRMNELQIHEKILSLGNTEVLKEKTVNDLLKCMVDMDTEGFEKALTSHFKSGGASTAITQVVFPFLEKIGVLWQTGHINPAQEHLVTNIIRQKLMAAIDNCIPPAPKSKKVMLFLPEGEYHELGILFINYVLRSQGLSTVYLGTNVPLKDAEYVSRYKNPDFLFIHLTSTAPSFSFNDFLKKLKINFPNKQIIISGQLAREHKRQPQQGIELKKSLKEVLDFFSDLG